MVVTQLRRQASLRAHIPELMLHLDPEPQHIGRLALHSRYFTEPRKIKSRLPVVLLFVIYARQTGVGRRHVWRNLQRPQPIRASALILFQTRTACARIMQRLFRCYIGNILQCRIKISQRLRRASRLAQKQAVIIAQLRIVGRKAQGVKEIFLSRQILLPARLDQRTHAIGLGVAWRQQQRLRHFLKRHVQLACAVVGTSQLQTQAGALLGRIGGSGGSGTQGLVIMRSGSTADQQHSQADKGHSERAMVSHAFPHQERISTIFPKLAPNFCWYSVIFSMRSCTRVRSLTSPANWPQAASISSPRVLRTVVIMPPSISTWANALMRGFFERNRPDSGNGLNGIRLNLQFTPNSRSCTSASSSRACSSLSLTPSSMQYSKVMKSRGANSR